MNNKRICIFVDFLGWTDKIINTSKLEEEARERAYSEIMSILQKFFNQCEGGQGKKDSEEHKEADRQLWEDFYKHNDFQFTAVSDCIVISIPYPQDNDWKQCLTLFYMIACAQREVLQRGYLTRGGIAVGDLIHTTENVGFSDIKSNIVFGKAHLDAMQIEKEVAKHPVVAFKDEELFNNIKAYIDKTTPNYKPKDEDYQSCAVSEYFMYNIIQYCSDKEYYFLDYCDPYLWRFTCEDNEVEDIIFNMTSEYDKNLLKSENSVALKYLWVKHRIAKNKNEILKVISRAK